jgi:hypothetical protein
MEKGEGRGEPGYAEGATKGWLAYGQG